MIKESQKKFKDPKRQILEDKKQNIFKAKKIWNGYLKNFREELKTTQALINGRIEGGERIRIDEQLPEETVQSLSNLAESFQKRIEEGNQIFQAQNKYSEEYGSFFADLEQKRMQKLDKSKVQQTQAPGQKAASFDYNLVSEAGIGPVGLFWESVKSFFSDNEGARRVTLLKQLASLDANLSQIEYQITSARKTADIDIIRKRMYDLYRKAKSLKAIISYGKELNQRRMSEGLEEADPSQSYLSEDDDKKIKKIETDIAKYPFFKIYSFKNFDDKTKQEIEKVHEKILKAIYSLKNHPNSQRYKEIIIESYKDLISKCFDGAFESFSEYENRSSKTAKSTYSSIIKVAESEPYDPMLFKFKKWLSSIGLDFNIFLSIRSNLIDASDTISDCRKLLNSCIDDLRSGDEINYDLGESSLKECCDLVEQTINNLDSVSTFISENSVDDKVFGNVTKSVETSFLKSFFKQLSGLVGKKRRRRVESFINNSKWS